VQNAEDINANVDGMYIYHCVVIVKFTVQGPVVNQTVSSQSFTVMGLALPQASACNIFFFINIYLQDVNTYTSVPDSIQLFLVNQFSCITLAVRVARCYFVR
jgi:hypothetical protein